LLTYQKIVFLRPITNYELEYMKIALLGYGRMGKLIERIATEAGHTIVLRLQTHNSHEINLLAAADVAIDFSRPTAAAANIRACFAAGVPVVSGTTGWLEDWDNVVSDCQKAEGRFFYASNFSLGVNIFFLLNQHLAKLIAPYAHLYAPRLTEIHHIHKLDAPSGTGTTLARDLVELLPTLQSYQLENADAPINNKAILPIDAIRTGEVVGTHQVSYTSDIDTIRIEHEAHSRDGFARGAVAAAEWLAQKTGNGIFGMPDLLADTQ
jgi:4-hydroxy-tetrahydrodipicolinate reductase